MKEQQFDVGGMTCAACQANVEKCVLKLDGVKNVDVSLLSNSMKVEGVLNEITGNSLKARSKEDSSIGLLILYVRLA